MRERKDQRGGTVTYTEREVEGEGETRKIDDGEWEAFGGYEVFEVVYWTDQDREAVKKGHVGGFGEGIEGRRTQT